MRIGLDFDGVVTNLGRLKALAARRLFGKKIAPSKFDIEYVIERELLTFYEYEALKNFIYYELDAHLFTEPVRGSVEHIRKLLHKGHTIEIVTAREGKALDLAKHWLKTKYLSLPVHGVGFGNSKRGIAQGFDVFVDDYLIELYQMIDVVPNRFLLSWGYNEKFDETGVARRVKNWGELYDEICRLEINARV